ncbi:cob(I)yrinic acid a,c-diamide adenosyltransferase [Maribacter aquimaris]
MQKRGSFSLFSTDPGNGKVKTTAALGLAIRAVGADKKVS